MHRRGQMRIAVTTDGQIAIGRAEVDYYMRRGEIADVEHVFPVQFHHRAACRMADGTWRIMTPTCARNNPAVVAWYAFPAANGACARGY